jgi:hypothetical protein
MNFSDAMAEIAFGQRVLTRDNRVASRTKRILTPALRVTRRGLSNAIASRHETLVRVEPECTDSNWSM